MIYNIDMYMCIGYRMGTTSVCPLRENCKRFIDGQKVIKGKRQGIAWWFATPPYIGYQCKYQIKINDEKEAKKNR